MDFQVGDMIIMLPEADLKYGIAKSGSIGVVVKKTQWGITVKFDIDTLKNYNKNDPINGTFTVDACYMELYNPDGKGMSRVERKINAMWKRSKYYERHCMV